jgi:hypothetical protein
MNKKCAYKIKDLPDNKILWEVMPRIEGNKYIVTSAVDVSFSGPETYMFAANEKGKIINWSELDGSHRGSMDHKKCFENINYSIYE